ncbi:NAD(P)-dependent dehydrogenase (short-subunit alcohol dehydrogenase family) [Paenibacillus sp. V4I3]|uniref:SDR family NAD(P)-dependent oxidoreductase n=1 Tax=unclassified Paenibacillus TaxID=185978 RepID=UPI00278504F8|nr:MULTISPECIES: SDR family oxidoreductase [unclassified Paenibacillus]MDQ0875981.1 NAD(P)-dependent dehydrogenase (short-subunit alcohol dehydrogenase family) [Paenibacillus sp. V4I3]MDQ0888003.1 NAD(P)-dependent dehydrogenase (short-subunit alcohol dehydrogenase family) [Paenibacillus sp. V4I9]
MSKIAIVTGGSRGIGRSTVVALANRGFDTILTYNTNSEEADTAVKLVQESGRKAVALKLDVSNTSTFDAFVTSVKEALSATWGKDRFDILVNNAGTAHHGTFASTTEEELDTLYNIHIKGVFFLTQKLLPIMNDGGEIVNVSTGLTRIIVGSPPYAAVKGAIEVLTKYQAKELGPRRIKVNVVAPGAIQTDFSGGMVRDNPQVNKMVSDMTALGRPGLPEDLGMMIASLVSEENRWVNAQRIEVSGGMGI